MPFCLSIFSAGCGLNGQRQDKRISAGAVLPDVRVCSIKPSFFLLYGSAAQYIFAVIENNGLARGYGADRLFKGAFDSVLSCLFYEAEGAAVAIAYFGFHTHGLLQIRDGHEIQAAAGECA